MAYAALLDDESVQSHFLVVLRPRRRATGFTLFSGSVYVSPFDYGDVTSVWDGLTALNANTTAALAAGEYYHDVEASLLYVRLTAGGNPNATWLITAYEIYAGTTSAHHHRVPTDSSSRVVYFDPIVSKAPILKQTTENSEYGFSPVQSSSMTLTNAEHFFERHISETSWINAQCLIYHWLGALDVSNMKLIQNGLVLSTRLAPPSLELRIVDRIDQLSQEWKHPGARPSFYAAADFPGLDPNAVGKPIRAVYGLILDGFTPVNIDYVGDEPTTSDNRNWAVISGQTGLAELVRTVPAAPASTTTRTYVSSVAGLNLGDSVFLDKATDEYRIVTAVGANFIEHAALSAAATTGEMVKRGFVGRVTIIQNDVRYLALYGRDYTIDLALPATASGFTFVAGLEANLSMPETLRPSDRVYCRVYGPTNITTLGGPAFGVDDVRTGNMAHPSQFVLDALKRHLGVGEADLAVATFTQALTDQSSGVGFAIPKGASSTDFPKYRDVIADVLKSTLGKLIIDADGRWSMLTTKPLGAITRTIADDEILTRALQWEYDYSDLVGTVFVEYAYQEAGAGFSDSDIVLTVSAVSPSGTFLHRSSVTETQRSVWVYAAEAQEMADRLSYILGERRGRVTINTKNRFYDIKLGDNVEVSRVYLPGFAPDGETDYVREHAVVGVDKSRTQVTLTLNDQKGIEDNAGGW